MTGDAKVDVGHVRCAPCEEINILLQAGHQLSTSGLGDSLAELEALCCVVPKGNQLDVAVQGSYDVVVRMVLQFQMDSRACGPKLRQFSPPNGAVIKGGAVDHQEWDVYCFLPVLFSKGYEEFHVTSQFSGKVVESVEFAFNVRGEVALRQLESLEHPGVHYVTSGSCVYQDSSSIKVGHPSLNK